MLEIFSMETFNFKQCCNFQKGVKFEILGDLKDLKL